MAKMKSEYVSSSTVTQPHDKLIKRLLSNPEVAKDILKLYLPNEVSMLTNLNELSLQRDSFIDDEHRAFAVDLLYKTTFNNEDGYLWILLEHQRKDDPWLPVRIFKYMATIWDHIRRTSTSCKIPLIYPIVIYNGSRPYSYSLTFQDMIEPKASRDLFESFFKTPFCLVDLTTIEDESLREWVQDHVRGVALLMTMKHIFDRNIQNIFDQILVGIYKILDQKGSRDEVSDLLYYLLNESDYLEEDQFWITLSEKFSKEVEGKVMTIAQKLERRGFEKGIETGIEKGIEQGMEKGMERGQIMIAKRMLSEGYNLETITKLTKLSLDALIEVS